jgi:NAD(P)-dependent dehydrogenase (short-subunit alcohol dehydrogenase family)
MPAGYQSYTCAMAIEQSKGLALITGAGRRLGAAIAEELAAQGWTVALHCRQSQHEADAVAARITSRGGQARVYAHDLDQLTGDTQTDSVSQTPIQWLAGIESDMKAPIGLLVNNASRFAFDVPETTTGPDLMAHYQTNLVAPVLLTQAFFALRGGGQPQAPQSPVGCVINLLDQKLENLNPDFFSYTLSKASLLTATQLMAKSFAPVLRVVGVSPGITLPSADQTEAEFQKAHQMTPLGASSTANDIAQAVSWLASARAITGVNLMVDGGQHLLSSDRDVMFKIR